jgi:hypothetical protein
MSFTDTLYSLLPYIVAVVVIFIGWKIYKSYTSSEKPVEPAAPIEKPKEESPQQMKINAKEDDLCIACGKGTLQIYDTEDAINLACNSCNMLYMQWPLVK